MSAARRVGAVLALGVLAIGSLSACRSTFRQPGAAAFVGNTRITTDEVNKTADDLPAGISISQADARSTVASALTFNQLAALYAKDHGMSAPATDGQSVAEFAQQAQISDPKAASNRFVQDLYLENAWINQLLGAAPQSAKPTDAQMRETYALLQTQGVVGPGTNFPTYDSAKSQIAQIPNLGPAYQVRDDLLATEKKYDLSVNPLYSTSCSKAPCSPFTITLNEIQLSSGYAPTVELPLDMNTAPAVIDLPTPAATG